MWNASVLSTVSRVYAILSGYIRQSLNSHTMVLIVSLTGKDSKHARKSAGATHFCPPITAHGSLALRTADAETVETRKVSAKSMARAEEPFSRVTCSPYRSFRWLPIVDMGFCRRQRKLGEAQGRRSPDWRFAYTTWDSFRKSAALA